MGEIDAGFGHSDVKYNFGGFDIKKLLIQQKIELSDGILIT